MQKRHKRSLTLLEIMIVIVLIGIIGSVVGVNMKGSLEEGKAFKTRQAQNQIFDILMLEVAKGASLTEVQNNPEGFLESSGLIKGKGEDYMHDGWGIKFVVNTQQDGSLTVTSTALDNYEKLQNKKRNKKAGTAKQAATLGPEPLDARSVEKN